MWKNTYKDYKPDGDWIQHRVETGKGIVGCEMNERNGWGHAFQKPPRRRSRILTLLLRFLKKKR